MTTPVRSEIYRLRFQIFPQPEACPHEGLGVALGVPLSASRAPGMGGDRQGPRWQIAYQCGAVRGSGFGSSNDGLTPAPLNLAGLPTPQNAELKGLAKGPRVLWRTTYTPQAYFIKNDDWLQPLGSAAPQPWAKPTGERYYGAVQYIYCIASSIKLVRHFVRGWASTHVTKELFNDRFWLSSRKGLGSGGRSIRLRQIVV